MSSSGIALHGGGSTLSLPFLPLFHVVLVRPEMLPFSQPAASCYLDEQREPRSDLLRHPGHFDKTLPLFAFTHLEFSFLPACMFYLVLCVSCGLCGKFSWEALHIV